MKTLAISGYFWISRNYRDLERGCSEDGVKGFREEYFTEYSVEVSKAWWTVTMGGVRRDVVRVYDVHLEMVGALKSFLHLAKSI